MSKKKEKKGTDHIINRDIKEIKRKFENGERISLIDMALLTINDNEYKEKHFRGKIKFNLEVIQ